MMHYSNIVIPWTVDQHQKLVYIEDAFKDVDQVELWKSAGHYMPSLVIGLHQLDDPYEWMQPVVDYFSFLKDVKFCFHRLLPGQYLPTHYDKYEFYRKQHNINNIDDVQRYIVFLEDGADGHYLAIENTVYYNWKRGDCVTWQGKQCHNAVNLGNTTRYTLQITGHVSK
jgi:hypothetical protein